MKRVFVALPLPANLKALAADFKQRHGALRVRWLTGKNLHLTLLPPWATAEPDGIIKRLKTLAGTLGPLDLKFTRAALGPDPKQPRLIWAAGEPNSKLVSLKAAAERTLGFAPAPRAFRPHLTLARFSGRQAADQVQSALNQAINWRGNFSELALYESRLLPSGADYEILAEIEL